MIYSLDIVLLFFFVVAARSVQVLQRVPAAGVWHVLSPGIVRLILNHTQVRPADDVAAPRVRTLLTMRSGNVYAELL